MNDSIGWVLVLLISILIEAELIAWCGPLQRLILRIASMRLSTTHRARYREEWIGELNEVPAGPFTRLVFVMSLLVRARAIERSVDEALADTLGVTNKWYLRHERELDAAAAFSSALRLEARRRRDEAPEDSLDELAETVRNLGWSRRFRRALRLPFRQAVAGRRYRLWESRPMNWRQVAVAWLVTLRRGYFPRFAPVETTTVTRKEFKQWVKWNYSPLEALVSYERARELARADRSTFRRWCRTGDIWVWVHSGHRYVWVDQVVAAKRELKAVTRTKSGS